jgi:hypothetical protein
LFVPGLTEVVLDDLEDGEEAVVLRVHPEDGSLWNVKRAIYFYISISIMYLGLSLLYTVLPEFCGGGGSIERSENIFDPW